MHIFNKFFICCLLMCFSLTILAPPALVRAEQKQEYIVCPKCGTKNPKQAKFCPKCGTKLEQIIVPVPEVQPQPKEPTPVEAAQKLILPEAPTDSTQTDLIAPPTADEPKIKALYTYGIALFEKGSYNVALAAFNEIIEKYPNTPYAEAALLMHKASYKMIELQKSNAQTKKKSDNLFATSFFGSLCGVGGAFLLLILIASGLD